MIWKTITDLLDFIQRDEWSCQHNQMLWKLLMNSIVLLISHFPISYFTPGYPLDVLIWTPINIASRANNTVCVCVVFAKKSNWRIGGDPSRFLIPENLNYVGMTMMRRGAGLHKINYICETTCGHRKKNHLQKV